MTYIYKHKETGTILKRDKPLKNALKDGFILQSWFKNMMMKANQIMKK
jgi:hypothetical protein